MAFSCAPSSPSSASQPRNGSRFHNACSLTERIKVVYAVSLYQVRSADVCAFAHAFGASGKWRELHRGLPGYVHSNLLVHTDFPTVHLLLEFWQSANDCERAEQRAALRAFTLSLRTIAISHMNLGVFSLQARTDLRACCGIYQAFPSRVTDLSDAVGKDPTTPLTNS
jgi:hypothetical protein